MSKRKKMGGGCDGIQKKKAPCCKASYRSSRTKSREYHFVGKKREREDVNMIDADRRPNVSFVGCGAGKLNWWRHSQAFTTHTRHTHTSDHRK